MHYAECSHAVGLGDTNRTVKGVMMLRIPTLHSTVAVFTASFHGFFFARKEKERSHSDEWSALHPRVVDGGVTATGVLSRERGNLITVCITLY